jgi:hypothetical protein
LVGHQSLWCLDLESETSADPAALGAALAALVAADTPALQELNVTHNNPSAMPALRRWLTRCPATATCAFWT